MKTNALCLLALCGTLGACSHPLDISGQGEIRSSFGGRDCSAAAAPCENTVSGEYIELFSAEPAEGWVFDSWDNCDTLTGFIIESGNTCAFSISAEVVKSNWLKTMPALRANFVPDVGVSGGDTTSIAGLWRWTDLLADRGDDGYTLITTNGVVTRYDYLGDAWDQDDNCFEEQDTFTLEPVSGDVYTNTFDNGSFRNVRDDRFVRTGNSLEWYAPADAPGADAWTLSPLTIDDLQPRCD